MPERTCVGCRRCAEQSELVRVRLDALDEIVVDGAGIGRGAWLCPSIECIELARRKRAISRSLRSRHADDVFAATLLGWLSERSP